MNTSSLALHGDKRGPAIATPFLKFHLGLRTPALLATQYIQEAITIAAHRVSPMPNMPSCMMGLINRRSRVLWVVDLAHLLGLPIGYTQTQQYNLILLQVGTTTVGLRVHEIDGIQSVQPDQIQSPLTQISPQLVPYLRGCLLQSNEILLVLDAEAIVRSSALQHS
jgi:twitching motility protein PilI